MWVEVTDLARRAFLARVSVYSGCATRFPSCSWEAMATAVSRKARFSYFSACSSTETLVWFRDNDWRISVISAVGGVVHRVKNYSPSERYTLSDVNNERT